jgi:hypothetical protein
MRCGRNWPTHDEVLHGAIERHGGWPCICLLGHDCEMKSLRLRGLESMAAACHAMWFRCRFHLVALCLTHTG